MNLRQLALDALLISGPREKCTAVQAMAPAREDLQFAPPGRSRLLAETLPGRTARPLLVRIRRKIKRLLTAALSKA